MAQVQRSSSIFLKGRRAGILSSNQNRGCFEGGSPDSNHEIGLMRKRRLSADHQDPEITTDYHGNVRLKRFRLKGYFSKEDGIDSKSHATNDERFYSAELEDIDRPIHSTRFLEETIRQIREECNNQFIFKENELRSSFETMMNDHNQTQNENRILKKAINIQNNRCKELEVQLKDSHEREASTSAYAKRLEQENYILGLRVRQMGPYNGDGELNFVERRPPDVF